jgi:HPt (histidine-containing phosphotransfer) domain-containing protein
MTKAHLMIDDAAFDAAKEMMNHKFDKIIGYYLEDARVYVDAIKEGLENKDAESIIPAAHTIKSSSRQIGAFALASYAANIEEAARAHVQTKDNFEKLAFRCENIEMMFQGTEQEIRNRLQQKTA